MASAAIFDVDGTLIAGKSVERRFISYLQRNGELRFCDLCRVASDVFPAIAEGRSVTRTNKRYLEHRYIQEINLLAQNFFDQEVKGSLLRPALDRIAEHRDRGHSLVLISGTPDFLLEPLASYLGVRFHAGTAIGIAIGKSTGRISGPHPFGTAKVDSLFRLYGAARFDLSTSYAYGNDFADRHLLATVGNPVAANPDRRLRRLALKLGWSIEDFRK